MTEYALAHPAGPTHVPMFFNHDNEQARASADSLSGLAADVVVLGHGPVFNGSPAGAVSAPRAAA